MLSTALESHNPLRELSISAAELKQHQHLHKPTSEEKIKHLWGSQDYNLKLFPAQHCKTLIFYNYRGASYHNFRSLVIWGK